MLKTKVLFVAEAVTLAHVARPLGLCRGLDRQCFEVSIACASRSHWVLGDFPGQVYELDSISSEDFLAALASGSPLYPAKLLYRYVEEDLRLLERTQPDLVIGDFRISLSVSARLLSIPYLTISNAYWSPDWKPESYPVPSLPLTRYSPIGLAQSLFSMARPLAFALHCRPLNQVRRHFGLPSLGNDLRQVYTDADHVLYADAAELFPGIKLREHHHFLGPVLWSPSVAQPDWWLQLGDQRPLIYVTLGSSGQARLLPEVVQALSGLDAVIVVSTAGKAFAAKIPENVYIAPYLNGEEAAQRASLVICNGGSPTTQQALAAGVPVIGIAGNLDQFLNMVTLSTAGAGAALRADRFMPGDLSRLARAVLTEGSYAKAAQRLARIFAGYNSASRLEAILSTMIEPPIHLNDTPQELTQDQANPSISARP